MKPGEMMTITRAEEGGHYIVTLANLYSQELGPDEALACLAQSLFGDMGTTPQFLWSAEKHIDFHKSLARHRDE